MSTHDDCFGRLVHVGFSPGPLALTDREVPRGEAAWQQAEQRWRKDVAEPFFAAILELAEQFRLPVGCRVRHDPQTSFQDAIAFCELLRPDGGDYGFPMLATTPAVTLAAIEADWGVPLAAARAAYPYDFAWEREDAARLRALERFAALVASGVPATQIRWPPDG